MFPFKSAYHDQPRGPSPDDPCAVRLPRNAPFFVFVNFGQPTGPTRSLKKERLLNRITEADIGATAAKYHKVRRLTF
jgi:hypothetical protein